MGSDFRLRGAPVADLGVWARAERAVQAPKGEATGRSGRHSPAAEGRRAGRWPCANAAGYGAGKDGDVLHGGDEVILDLLAPETAPAGALEVVQVGAAGEATFHQMAPPGAVSVRLGQSGDGVGKLQCLLFPMAGDGAADLAVCAVLPQGAGGADLLVRDVVGHLSALVEAARAQGLSGRADIAVVGLVVEEFLLGVAAFAAVVGAQHRADVGTDAVLDQFAVVFDRAVLAIGDGGDDFAAGIVLVLFDQRQGGAGTGE